MITISAQLYVGNMICGLDQENLDAVDLSASVAAYKMAVEAHLSVDRVEWETIQGEASPKITTDAALPQGNERSLAAFEDASDRVFSAGEFWVMIPPQSVDLYETGGGALFLNLRGSLVVYGDFEHIGMYGAQAENLFPANAAALAAGETADWTVPRFDGQEFLDEIQDDKLNGGGLVATWENGTVTIHGKPGRAAQMFLYGEYRD